MRQKTLPLEKAPAFHIQPLEAMDEHCAFHEGILRQLPGFEFIWITKGRGSLTVDFQEHMFSENAIYCLSPGQFRKVMVESVLEGYYLSLSADFYFAVKGEVDYFFLSDRFSGGRNIMLLMPEPELLHELFDIIQLLGKEYDRNALSRIDILTGFLKIFMLYLSRSPVINSCRYRRDNETEKVIAFLTLVKENFLTKKMVADYASDMALTPSYLNYVVKKISGFNASYHIHQCVILEAKRQVVSGKLRMKELAYYLGFDDCAHFSKYFKNICGVNFSSFRNDFIKV